MAIDTPATIAILGAGPIGLEAALYARFLGYDVDVYERGEIAANVRAWGHVRLFSPFALNRSSLGLSALSAQEAGWKAPGDDTLLTGHEYVEQYLLPLSQTDLLGRHVHQGVQVVSVGRADLLKTEEIGTSRRGTTVFRLLLEDRQGHERLAEADVVIDATGTYGQHRWMGQGGIPALGERTAAADIAYHLPDVLHGERNTYAGKHTLLIGAGYSAATSALALAELAAANPGTRVTWVTRQPLAEAHQGPIAVIPEDRLVERDRIARDANRLAARANGALQHCDGTWIEAIESAPSGTGFKVQLGGQRASQLEVERIIANVGYRPDNRLFAELQVHQCYASEGPMRLATKLVGQDAADCLAQKASDAEALLTTEPNFYVLGSKSYGRNSKFLMSIGLQQIVQLFTIIGDRHDLNLYEGLRDLTP